MEEKRWERILSPIKARVGHPDFLPQIFSSYLKEKREKDPDPIKDILKKELDQFSKRLDQTLIQDSCSVRNAIKARKLGELLVQDDGRLDLDLLEKATVILKNNLYPIGPDRHHDYRRNEHILSVLQLLKSKKELLQSFHRVAKPFSNPTADAVIRATLQLDPKASVGDKEARQATLSAWFCYLRQNVGSCFATAPAIIVHDEQPEQFLADIQDLFARGQLSRTFNGVQYSAPLCPSWGAGDLRKPFLFHPNPEQSPTQIWESPGLIVALTKVKILDGNQTLLKRIENCKQLIVKVFKSLTVPDFMDTETLIRKILLHQMEVSEEELEKVEALPPAMIQGGILLGPVSKDTDIKRVEVFKEQLEIAYNAFKSLTDNALLKSWEFTVASFAEVKPSISRYNMYHSLGLGAEDQGGIGHALYVTLQEKINTLNAEVQEHQEIYEQMHMQVQHVEGRLRRASDQEAQYLKQEYRNRVQEMQYYERLRDEAHTKGHRFANLFNLLIDLYDEKFVKYFQEVYDPDIRGVTQGPYDDSPAGFRLLYKGGRSTITAQWERIDGPSEFADALARFFIATERDVVHHPVSEGIGDEVTSLITSLVNFVKTDEFLESAFYRMAIAYQERPIKDPLKNLDKVTKKPWVYTSGGTMGSLVGAYFSGGEKPDEEGRWVENSEELLAFLVDVIKQVRPAVANELLNQKLSSFLMHSPTHAFLLKPYSSLIQKGWESERYTYSWIKDTLLIPGQQVIDTLHLDDGVIAKLLEQIRESLPKQYHHFFNKAFFRTPATIHCRDFRAFVMRTVERDRMLHYGQRSMISAADVDSLLFRQLPMIRSYQLRDRVEQITQEVLKTDELQQKQVMKIYDRLADRLGREEVIGSAQLREVVQAILILYLDQTASSEPFLQSIVSFMRKKEWMLPEPVVFADTNWVKDDFAMVIGPTSNQLELWRVDAMGIEGFPMSMWKHWVDGSRQDRTWGVYTNPFQYRALLT